MAHGDADHYFPLDHAYQLAAAASHVELWVEYGFEHAENAISDELTERIAAWVGSRSLGVCQPRAPSLDLTEARAVSRVEVRYWAAAREAAGVEVETIEVEPGEGTARRRPGGRTSAGTTSGSPGSSASSSLLVGGVAVGHLDPMEVVLPDGSTVEVLPPFAGG